MSEENPIKIGLDFDSTITKHPEFFGNLTRNSGDEFYVITARPEKDREYVEGYLKNHDIRVQRVCMIMEDLVRADDRTYIETVFREKPRMCKDIGIQAIYDDDLRILNHLKEEIPNIILLLVL
mgnify:CR=1 FL=1